MMHFFYLPINLHPIFWFWKSRSKKLGSLQEFRVPKKFLEKVVFHTCKSEKKIRFPLQNIGLKILPCRFEPQLRTILRLKNINHIIMGRSNLINIWQMFNLGTDDLAVKPYIPHKSWFQWIVRKCLAWYHGYDYFWPPRLWRLLEAKEIISRRTLWHFNSTFSSSLSASSAYPQFTNKFYQLWLSASIQPPYLEF